jgi:hypothetical protein
MTTPARIVGWRWAAGSVVGLIALAQVLFYFPRTVDDMFIFLRYAENAANGHGLVYNVGERVEGFSSVSWVALLVPGELIGVNAVTWSKLLAIASVGGLLVGLYHFARERLGVGADAPPGSWRQLLPFGAPAFTACCSYVMSWAMFGLETPLFLALLVWSAVTLGRYVAAPSRSRLIAAGAVCGGFALSRPEAPMMLVAVAGGIAIQVRSFGELRAQLRRVAFGVAPAAAAFGAYSVFRRLYFGLWFPHTYYSKTGNDWHVTGLRQLAMDGASGFEIVLVFGGIALAALAMWRRRDAVLLAVTAASVVFVARVEVDWMPNVRYWLPLWVTLPMIWLWAADRIATRSRLLAIIPIVVLLGAMVHQARIDMRYSVFSYRARGSKAWTKPKTEAVWSDTWDCLQHVPPPSVRENDGFNMGMITQAFRLIESDARPLEDTWFIGPDIGIVGWVTPVNVWEPPGLFTPDVRVLGTAWKRHGTLTPALLHAALDRPIAMTELFDGKWGDAIKKDPVLAKRFEPTAGWAYFRERGAARPDRAQILARYHAALAKLPSGYFVMNLHGGPMGADFERRVQVVAAQR